MTSKYIYTKLSEAEPDSNESYNLYAVIVDATLPYKTNSRHVCSLKVMDPTLYLSEDDKDTKSCANVVIYAKKSEDLPVVSKIGDIIRVHRANVKSHKGQKQFNVNVYYNSSWCIFNTDDEQCDES
jgi:hypothetical protein